MTKEQIRNRILLRLKTQKEEEREQKSKIIKEKLFKSSIFKKAKRVMFYISFDGEVNTREMIKEAQNLGKIVAVPVCKKKKIMLPCVLGQRDKLKKGLYGIYQPAIEKLINLKDLDLVIVPGVAFDKQGNRLGRGKGYYDCLLNKIPKAPSIGLAFDFQILPHLPATDKDVSVNRAIFA